ncbi:MAG: hypothetical protein JWR38_3270 [Mucilaginibacter sp.]|nr:hypothetical protein [Mucilaginibacter sp.]
MKRYIPFIILLFLCLTGCKNDKQNTPSPSGKTYKIVFNASSSSQSINSTGAKVVNSLKTNAVGPVSSSAKRLYYIVYDSSGKLVHEIGQDSTVSDFGRIADDLPAGTYTCYFGAGQNYFYSTIASSTFLNYRGLGIPPTWEDWFYKKITLTITDSNINQDVVLERMVGQLQLNIEDAIPASVLSISITTIGELAFYDYLQGAFTHSQDIETFVGIPTANYKPTLLIGNTATPISIKITCYDSKGVVAQRTISNVQFTKNVKTILSGKLFTASKGDFAVGVNDTFDPTPFVTVKF